MATETEIERLVVRLVGDDSTYRAMMQNAAIASGVFEQEGEAIARAQEEAQEALKQTRPPLEDIQNKTMSTSRSFRFLGMEISNAGMAISSFNAPAGMTVLTLGGMTSSAGEAMHAYRALGISISSIGTLISKNIGLFAGSAAALAGVGAYIALYKYAMNDLNKTLEKSAELQELVVGQQSRRQQSRIREIDQENYLPFKIGLLEKEVEKQQAIYDSAMEDASEFKDKLKDIKWYTGGSMFIRDADQAVLEAGLEEARNKYNSAINTIREYQEAIDSTTLAIKKQKEEEGRARKKSILEDIKSIKDQYAQLILSEKDAAKYAFIARHELLQYPDPAKLKQAKDAIDQLFNERRVKEVQSLNDALADMKAKEQEILDPLNSQLRITHDLEKANREYARAHNESVADIPKEIQDRNALMAAEREHIRLLQESKSVYDQFKDPLDKMIESQTRLRQLFEAGGFEKGEKGAKAYQKALAEAYGQAHKEYTAQFLGQDFDAIIAGTHAAERALYEYRLGMTAIPSDVATGGRPTDAKNNKPIDFWSSYDGEEKGTGKAMVAGIKTVSDGVKELVEQGKNRIGGQILGYAGFQ
jgi:hypothetical protein